MKNFKKIGLVVLTAVATLSLVACGSKNSTTKKADSTTTKTVTTNKITTKKVTTKKVTTTKATVPTTKLTIEFETFGGTTISKMTVAAGATINMPEDPFKDGYTFEGWYEDSSFKEAFTGTIMPNRNLKLYAKFVEVKKSVVGCKYTSDNMVHVLVGDEAAFFEMMKDSAPNAKNAQDCLDFMASVTRSSGLYINFISETEIEIHLMEEIDCNYVFDETTNTVTFKDGETTINPLYSSGYSSIIVSSDFESITIVGENIANFQINMTFYLDNTAE